MKEKITNHSEWLEQQPVFKGDNKEVFENADGGEFIPVAIVESLLDSLTDYNWSTENFSVYVSDITELDKEGKQGSFILLAGTVTLVVNYQGIQRSIIGCANKRMNDFLAKKEGEKNNEDFNATMLSLALCNAAKKLGNRFGRSLNGRGDNKVQADNKEMPLPIPDKEVIKIWLRYCTDGDTEMQKIFLTIYDNQTLHNALKK